MAVTATYVMMDFIQFIHLLASVSTQYRAVYSTVSLLVYMYIVQYIVQYMTVLFVLVLQLVMLMIIALSTMTMIHVSSVMKDTMQMPTGTVMVK